MNWENIVETTVLACGLDFNKSIIFNQSSVRVSEVGFFNLYQEWLMNRMTNSKKKLDQKENASVAFVFIRI